MWKIPMYYVDLSWYNQAAAANYVCPISEILHNTPNIQSIPLTAHNTHLGSSHLVEGIL